MASRVGPISLPAAHGSDWCARGARLHLQESELLPLGPKVVVPARQLNASLRHILKFAFAPANLHAHDFSGLHWGRGTKIAYNLRAPAGSHQVSGTPLGVFRAAHNDQPRLIIMRVEAVGLPNSGLLEGQLIAAATT